VRVFVAIPVINDGVVLGAVALSRTPISLTKALYQHRANLMIAAGAAVALALGLAFIAALVVIRPVEALVAQTTRIAAGDVDALEPLDNPGTSEIARLSDSFVAMATTLNARGEYLATFASNVSHAFKTPLTSIRGSVELLRDHLPDMTPGERHRFFDILERDGERMERLVQRLLELARADVMRPGKGRVDVPAILERLADRYRAEGLPVTLQHGEGVRHVRMSEEVLESIVCNLLDNARMHAGARSPVTLSTRPAAADVQVIVADDGPGVPEAVADKIFEPFYTTARDSGGSGLGLAIVRALVAGHGGRLALCENRKGFTLTIPA